MTSGRERLARGALMPRSTARLGYAPAEQHYFSGFVARGRRARAVAADPRRGARSALAWLRGGLRLGAAAGASRRCDPVRKGGGGDAIRRRAVPDRDRTGSERGAKLLDQCRDERERVRGAQCELVAGAAAVRRRAGGARGRRSCETLLSFFRARRGPAVAFRFRDPYDNSSNGMTRCARGDRSGDRRSATARRTASTLVKNYGPGEKRRITRPVAGTRAGRGGRERGRHRLDAARTRA